MPSILTGGEVTRSLHDRDVLLSENLVAGEYGQLLTARLCDKETVEWITVNVWQLGNR